MSGFKFSVPYNNDFSLLEKLVEMKNLNGNKISEVYLPIPQEYFGSGRIVSKLSLKEFIKTTKFCHENGLKINMTMNSTCEGIDWYSPRRITKTIKIVKILNEKYDLDALIVANPLFIQKIKKEVPKIEIIASAFSDIDCIEKAMFFNKLGADTLTLNGLNRNLEALKEIKERVDVTIRLMVNEGCIWKCPFRQFHNNFTSHASEKSRTPIDFCSESCIKLREFYPYTIINSDWILPEWLKYYKKITTNFKIVGRTMPTEWIIKRVKNYLSEEYKGNLIDLLESAFPKFQNINKWYIDTSNFDENFFEKVTSCDKNCFKCGYCDEVAKKIIEMK